MKYMSSLRWLFMPPSIAAMLLSTAVLSEVFAEGDLSYRQLQAVKIQEKNMQDLDKKIAQKQASYLDEQQMYKGKLVPSYYKEYLDSVDDLLWRVDGALQTIEKARSPVSHSRVKKIIDWQKNVRANLLAWRGDISGKYTQLSDVADPSNYPELDNDWEKLGDMKNKLSGIELYNVDQAKSIIAEYPDMTKWYARKWKEYKPLISMTGGKDSKLYKRFIDTANAIKSFKLYGEETVESSMKNIPGYLRNAEQLVIDDAQIKKSKRHRNKPSRDPGLKTYMKKARDGLDLWGAFTGGQGKTLARLQSKYDEIERNIELKNKSKIMLRLANARVPADMYAGDDADELKTMVLDRWNKTYKGDQILSVVLPDASWTTRKTKQWLSASKEFLYNDVSSLRAHVVVRKDDKVATVYLAYINRDNDDGVLNIGVHTKDDNSMDVLIVNIK